MAHWIDELEELCKKVNDEIADANMKLKGKKMTTSDAEYLDKLTHMLKSIKTTIAMGEYDDRQSQAFDMRSGRVDRRSRDMMREPRMASYRERDRDGRSGNGETQMIDELQQMLYDTENENVKSIIRKAIYEIERN